MLHKFKDLLNECLAASLVVFVSSDIRAMDSFKRMLSDMVTHTYYNIDSKYSYEKYMDIICNNEDDVIFIDLSYNPMRFDRKFRIENKTIFIFKYTNNIGGNANYLYSTPRALLYESDIIYNIKENKLCGLKNRERNAIEIECDFNNMLRYEKIKKLML